MYYQKVYYEPATLQYELGQRLKEKFSNLEWIPIESHNRITELCQRDNHDFVDMKHYLIVGIRKTHQYVVNHKSSDYLVPFTSSGCSAMCLYCYLVCNYNKCSYLRLYVNVEEIMDRLIRKSHQTEQECTFEIGSNSDLILENQLTGNLDKIISRFAKEGRGCLTFPTKFSMVDSLLSLDHGGKTWVRMSVNPEKIVSTVELGTSPLKDRLQAINRLVAASYPVGILIAPVIFVDNWPQLYLQLLDQLENELTDQAKNQLRIEVIFMTYSYVHKAINEVCFPKSKIYDADKMKAQGRGKYYYKKEYRQKGEEFFRHELSRRFGEDKILYIS